MARMMNAWGDIAIVGGIFPLIVADIPKNLAAVDAAYFRQSREARFGKTPGRGDGEPRHRRRRRSANRSSRCGRR